MDGMPRTSTQAMPDQPPGRRRAHTGRRRNEEARQAVLDAALRHIAGGETRTLTIDGIARTAGVGKQTIYRWWPSKGAILLEALTQRAETQVPVPDTGDIETDLTVFLTATFAGVQDPATAQLLRAVTAEAAHDPQLASVVRDFIDARRAVLARILRRGQTRHELSSYADLDLLIDQTYGLFWYRLLLGHADLSADTAMRMARCLVLLGADSSGVTARCLGPPSRSDRPQCSHRSAR
jgi:AcrR family transcriptional regulator